MKAYYSWVLATGLLICGCTTPMSTQEGPKASGSTITDRSMWRVSGNLLDLRNAIDGSLSTYAVSSGGSENPTITVNLGKPCVFNTVIIEHGSQEMGFCRRMALFISTDGETFTKVCEADDCRSLGYLLTITPVFAQYVRVRVMAMGGRPWAVAEIVIR